MIKQYFSTLLRRVGMSSLIEMAAVLLLMVACPVSNTGGDNGGKNDGNETGTPLKPPAIKEVVPVSNDGALKVSYTPSTSIDYVYTIITAKNDKTGEEVKLKVTRGDEKIDSDGSYYVIFSGLDTGERYTVHVAAVNKSGAESALTNNQKVAETAVTDTTAPVLADIKGFEIVPVFDTDTSLKVKWNAPYALVMVDKIEVIAVPGDVANAAAITISKDSVKQTVDPNDTQEIALKGLTDNKVQSGNKVKVFYRLCDAVPNKSPWYALNDGNAIILMAKADAILKSVAGLDAKAGEQRITEISWTAFTEKDTMPTGSVVYLRVTSLFLDKVIATHTTNSSEYTAGKVESISGTLETLLSLYGVNKYEITAIVKAPDGRRSNPATETVTITDTTAPSGTVSQGGAAIAVTANANGNTITVSINKEPFENDYAYTLLGVRFGADGTKAKESTETFKSQRIERGATHHTFKDLKEGYYQAYALFYDVEGNPKTDATKVDAADTQAIAANATVPTTSSIVITHVTSTAETRGRVKVTWNISGGTPKTIKIVPVQYDKSSGNDGKNALSATTMFHHATFALLNGEYDFDSKKYYAVTVVATDDLGLEVTGTSTMRVQVNTKIPTNFGEYTTPADAATVNRWRSSN